MKYEKIIKGEFVTRPNRFVAIVRIDGREEKVHVKNTGRCQELLLPGATVYLEDFKDRMGKRKMRYSLVCVEKGKLLINMDSQAPNKVCKEALTCGALKLPQMETITFVQSEKTYGNSRFDFYIEDETGTKGWLEVKGVTLEMDGVVAFPDAPSLRAVKHVQELIKAREEGYESYVLFVVQMEKAKIFRPNIRTHEEFGKILKEAKKAGVHLLAYTCKVTPDTLKLAEPIEVEI